jgi:hypothetical protein
MGKIGGIFKNKGAIFSKEGGIDWELGGEWRNRVTLW